MPRFLICLALFSALPALQASAEDTITLRNQDIFMGRVIALQDGIIQLDSPHSATPLKILNKDLLELNFANTDTGELPKNSQVLNLRNGDSFPGQVTSLNDSHLGFQTWFAGALEIPRNLIDSVYFGVTPQDTLFRGPKNIKDWVQDNSSGWSFRDGVLTSSKATFIGKNLALPESFIFGVNISWKSSPGLRIHICSDQVKPTEKKTDNSYLITINSAGIEVRRVMPKGSSGPAYHSLITHSTKLSEKKNKRIRLELRTNRKTRNLQLYLDGVELEKGIDPADPPSGSHILFESTNNTRSNSNISGIILQDWDSSTQLQRLEPREADDTDTLAVEDGDRFSGDILSYDATSPALPFSVKSPLSPDPIQIPLANCSVIYFAKGADREPSKGQYQLDLRTGGKLTLSGIRLGKDKLTATHPSLGELQVNRRIMRSISSGK